MKTSRIGAGLVIASTVAIIPLLVSATSAAAEDEGTGGAVYPVEGKCPVGKAGTPMVVSPVTGACYDPTPLTPHEQQVLELKTTAAELLQASKAGDAAAAEQLESVVADLRELTGETAIRPSLSGNPDEVAELGFTYVTMYKQVNSYYCGPATAESILRYTGPTTSLAYDTVYGGYPSFTSNSAQNQGLMANFFWLATDYYGGTNWGQPYMPFTLNSWFASSWYGGTGTPNVGGSLNQTNAWSYIDLNMTYGYPIAENVHYGWLSYWPSGFAPGPGYAHWDVVKGNWIEDPFYSQVKWVSIGQVYASPGYSWTPSFSVPWNSHWPAIGAWHGIVH